MKAIDVDVALEFCDRTIALKKRTEGAFLEIGRRLRDIREKELWHGRWEDFDHFCRSDMKLTEATASKLITVYERFILELGVSPEKVILAGGYTTAYLLKPLATSKEAAEEWLDKAITAESRRDLEILVREDQTGLEQAKCQHPDAYYIKLMVCPTCGEKHRVDPEMTQ